MKKDLRELLGYPGPLTHRQYLVWQEWLVQQYGQAGGESHGVEEREETPESVAARDKAFFAEKVRGSLNVAIWRPTPGEQAYLDSLPEWQASQERMRLAREAQKRKAGV